VSAPSSSPPRPARVLAQADQDLRALWTPTGQTSQAPRTRASTMNLVVVAATQALAERWSPVVDDVLRSIPARAIVVALDPDGEDHIDASVRAVCPPGGGAAVCSERVTLRVSGALCARVASCVDALSAADVPTTLVWLARVRVEDPAFGPLARWSNRVVLEASTGSLASLAHVVQWARGRPAGERPGISELAWTRLAPWQELCARMFDEGRVRHLTAGVTRVRLVQASPAGASLAPEGALMLGWLATRLGWKASSLAGQLRLLRADGAHIQVHLQADGGTAAPRGALLAVEIEASLGDASLHGEVLRSGEEDGSGTWRLEVHVGGETRCVEQQVRSFADEPARLLERTLRRPVNDDALAESVGWADELGADEIVCA
jgi:glucose-6-phosphate dehydrogenase assembly protein OpcA